MEVKDRGYTKRLYAICLKEFTAEEWRFLPSLLTSCGLSWNMAAGVDRDTIQETVIDALDTFEKLKQDGVN
jgi:hypothetical protein